MLNRPRIPLPRLIEALENDPKFVSQALEELAYIDRVSTYSPASAVSGLFRHWLVERELKCYSRGRVVEDVTALSVCEIAGSFDLSLAALEDGLLIDSSEFFMLLKTRGFDVPSAFGADDNTKARPSYSWPGIETEQEQARRNAGRYQIREAAEQLQLHAGERADTMIEKLSKAAFEGNLPVHLPGEKARHAYPQDGIVRSNVSTLPGGVSYFAGTDWRQHVRDFYEEAYWDDLNAWLAENEQRIDWRFPNPQHQNDKEIMVEAAEKTKVSLSGLGRKEILSVDWPLINGFNEDSFSRALSDVPNWLKPARIAKGAPGKGSALWNPAIVAACLLEKNYAKQAALTNLMRKSFPDWLEQWGRQQGE